MTQDCSHNELYALQVLDDSMEPEFPEKCIIVIEPSQACASGAFVIITVDGERWFRQFITDNDNKNRLIALKDGYPDIELEGSNYQIEGIVVQRNIKRKIKHYRSSAPTEVTQV